MLNAYCNLASIVMAGLTRAKGQGVLKQRQYDPIPVPEQIVVLLEVTSGIFDAISIEEIERARKSIREGFRKNLPELYQRIQSGEKLENGERQSLIEMCISALGREKDGTV